MTTTDDHRITDPAELHTCLLDWAAAKDNTCVIPTRIALMLGSYEAMLRLERLGGCEPIPPGWVIRKAAVITDDGRHVCLRCHRAFIGTGAPSPPSSDAWPIAAWVYPDEFCSDECRRTDDCLQCGAEYIRDTDRDWFCSDECRQWNHWITEDPVGRFSWRYLTEN